VGDAQLLPAGRATSRKRQHLVREVVETVVLTLLIYFAVHFSIQPYFVNGPSMQPGLHTGQYVMVNLLKYHFATPQRGDVVVLYSPFNRTRECKDNDPEHECFIKRVIAVPGDKISITAAGVYINGKKLTEPYTYPVTDGQNQEPNVVPDQILKNNQYWVLGDNRFDSTDSSVFGAIDGSSIIGKAEFVFWPLNAFHGVPTYPDVFNGLRK
jgi:signal peptidase I